jgi:UDP:flavonoid glycosyltransferase YjiC (YdhE family)
VFIHGGLATIKESIWESVPIIIVPHGKDQMDNAMRIRRNGIGVVSEVSDLGPTQLRNLLTEATASAWIEQNLTKFRDIFIAREAAKPSLPIIQSALTP